MASKTETNAAVLARINVHIDEIRAARLARETPDQRAARLARENETNAAVLARINVHLDEIRAARLARETPDQRAARLAREETQCRETPDQRASSQCREETQWEIQWLDDDKREKPFSRLMYPPRETVIAAHDVPVARPERYAVIPPKTE